MTRLPIALVSMLWIAGCARQAPDDGATEPPAAPAAEATPAAPGVAEPDATGGEPEGPDPGAPDPGDPGAQMPPDNGWASRPPPAPEDALPLSEHPIDGWAGPELINNYDRCRVRMPPPPAGCTVLDRTGLACSSLESGCLMSGWVELTCGDEVTRRTVAGHVQTWCEIIGDMDGDGLDPAVGDCDDTNANIHPRAEERCDAVDSDCDGDLVDGFPDADGDGMPDCADEDADGDGVAKPDDCDDADPRVWPGSAAGCKAGCTGDDLDGDGTPDCADKDDDGDGTPDARDCGPRDPAIHPGATEVCDAFDTDCDGEINEGFEDLDGDGLADCIDPDDDGDTVHDERDCAPRNRYVFFDAPEFCDQLDTDCDGDLVDHYFDADADNDGVPEACEPGGFGAPPPNWPPKGVVFPTLEQTRAMPR